MTLKKITTRNENFSQWYLDIIEAADLAEHAVVRGCMVVKPYGYAIWEKIQSILDKEFKKRDIENAYFPLLIPESFMSKEAEHIEGFAPECATVTQIGQNKLEENFIIRPTSETIIYDSFAKWIHSYRDLPILINQWCNVMRWELRPRLFLRTSEFLWQEGHTCHYTDSEADNFAREMLQVYKEFQENYMATPVISGEKSAAERFAGAKRTYTVEAMMQDGKAVQNGTAHYFGRGFASQFNVKYLDEDNLLKSPATTSWGVSTRMIGSLIMTHSDDRGLVLPPNIAPIQVVIIPYLDNNSEQNLTILEKAEEIKLSLEKAQISVKLDRRQERFGEKIFKWEKKGVPIRVEIGPKDIVSNQVIVARRDNNSKSAINMTDSLDKLGLSIKQLLEDIQKNLFEKALSYQKSKTVEVSNFDEFIKKIDEGNFVIAHYDGSIETEKKIKDLSKATTRCIPFDLEQTNGKCILTGVDCNTRIIFGKSY